MGEWSYTVTRLHGDGTETVLDRDVPIGDVVLTSTLSGPDAFDGTISPEIASLKAEDGSPLIVPWSTAIYALMDQHIRLGVIVTSLRARNDSLDIEGVGFSGYLRDMPWLTAGKDYAGWDSLRAVRDIWATVQNYPRGNVGLQIVGDSATGQKFGTVKAAEKDSEVKPLVLSWETTHDLADVVDDLAMWSPFDYYEHHEFIGETDEIAHHLHVGSPTVGNKLTDLRFMVGENVTEVPDVLDDGAEYASEVLILGAGEGSKMLRSSISRQGETRLRRPVVVSDRGLRSQSSVNQRANVELVHRKGLPEVEQIVLSEHPNAPLWSVWPGDQILVQTGPWGWQGDLSYWAKVIEITTRPQEPTSRTLRLQRVEGM